jgi:septal ring factor EnvC (AmiA/AmiB activator)
VPEVAKKSVPVPQEKPVEEVADSSAAGKAFTSLQGRMKMPVSGQLAGRFGSARSEGTSWKGVSSRQPPASRFMQSQMATWCMLMRYADSAMP